MTTSTRNSEAGIRGAPPAGSFPPTMRQLLTAPFSAGADYVVWQGRPCMIFADWDCAQDWSQYPVREVPLHLAMHGGVISEWKFCRLVQAMHAIPISPTQLELWPWGSNRPGGVFSFWRYVKHDNNHG